MFAGLETVGARDTKKRQIIRLARKDPFLRVEEIAVSADTTPRYVRTILSEAGMSLTQLRRSYARSMERQLGTDVVVGRTSGGLTDALVGAGKHIDVRQLRVTKVIDASMAGVLDVSPGEPLLQVSRVKLVNDKPFFVSEIVTHKNLTVTDDMVLSEKPLRQILGLEVSGDTTFVDRSLEVIEADEYLAPTLGLRCGDPVIKSGNVILAAGEKMGIEFNYFDAWRIKFVLAGVSEYTLKVIDKG